MTNTEPLHEILLELKTKGDRINLEGMERFGINVENAFGVKILDLRKIASSYKNNHALAIELWKSGYHEAKIIASIIDNPQEVTEEQMDWWVKDFDSWDVCDQVCGNLFDKTPFAFKKALEWAKKDEEYIKRAGFSLMAELAAHDKKASDDSFLEFFSVIESEARDERNFVKKAISWSLRAIGKRNKNLHAGAMTLAELILLQSSKASKWVAHDVLKELRSQKVTDRVNNL